MPGHTEKLLQFVYANSLLQSTYIDAMIYMYNIHVPP